MTLCGSFVNHSTCSYATLWCTRLIDAHCTGPGGLFDTHTKRSMSSMPRSWMARVNLSIQRERAGDPEMKISFPTLTTKLPPGRRHFTIGFRIGSSQSTYASWLTFPYARSFISGYGGDVNASVTCSPRAPKTSSAFPHSAQPSSVENANKTRLLGAGVRLCLASSLKRQTPRSTRSSTPAWRSDC